MGRIVGGVCQQDDSRSSLETVWILKPREIAVSRSQRSCAVDSRQQPVPNKAQSLFSLLVVQEKKLRAQEKAIEALQELASASKPGARELARWYVLGF